MQGDIESNLLLPAFHIGQVNTDCDISCKHKLYHVNRRVERNSLKNIYIQRMDYNKELVSP